jgi:hypothetical protein
MGNSPGPFGSGTHPSTVHATKQGDVLILLSLEEEKVTRPN